MITWLLSQIPFWVYVAAALLFAAAIFYFLSPVIVPLWAMTPKPIKWALGAIGALVTAFLYGLTRGNKAAKDRQKEIEAKGNARREDNDREIRQRPDDKLDRDFDKWVR